MRWAQFEFLFFPIEKNRGLGRGRAREGRKEGINEGSREEKKEGRWAVWKEG